MQIIEERKDGIYSLQSKEVKKIPPSDLARRILQALSKNPTYPKQLSMELNINEQKIYYHIRNLEKNGLIKVIRKEEHGGAVAKIYSLTKPSFFMKFSDLEKVEKIQRNIPSFLEPFITDNKINAKIVVGSPDPHGPEKARSRDAYYAIDFGLFLGTFASEARPSVSLDTEIRKEDLKDNLILIGGPVINKVTRLVNKDLQIKFNEKRNIYSELSKKTYSDDDVGIIVKTENPFDKEKSILVIAGKRYSGTRAAILSFLKKFDEIQKGNKFRKSVNAKIVLGIDTDYDGIIDDVRILE